MAPLAADRNTPRREARLLSVPVATGKTIYAGALVAASATGFATPGAIATTLTYLGRAEETVANPGADGAVSVSVRRGEAFKFKSLAGDPVTQASLGKVCYITDDETVSATNAVNTKSSAGKVVAVDADGVWVE